MSNHTPGPWHVWQRGQLYEIRSGKHERYTVALPHGENKDQNARLIAKTSEMLDALHEAAELILTLRTATGLDDDARKHSIEVLSIIDGIIEDVTGVEA